MVLSKKRKIGRYINEISKGEKLTLTETIEDKDLLIYLGLTNDANPLYIQHDYASQTRFDKPIVPSIMLTGIVSAAISKYLPGAGSHIIEQQLSFLKPVYHYATIQFLLEVVGIDEESETVTIEVVAEDEENEQVLKGSIIVSPPQKVKGLDGKDLENF
ncbi:enoyl-CoA hydratase [Bacillus sp. HMF5848]|uniref:MaoC/PaaZ C-terminal domain-containing protein n=1 Tax=Bacillus sp. HMF5848 TaxID=2495421 RepID=UPI000F78EA15|nr:MaoC/PaaZ C-terminal domain-containing protein [Bacillus sp. HMF5848]RSK28129.1 enoyl-CoA hydratase [Bacillus sp. HMF5848]